jgi:exonuclease III
MWSIARTSPEQSIQNGMNTIPDINFGIQNCNSLNVSVQLDKQAKKIAAILSIGAGIIFLSDIRLNADPASNTSNMFQNASNDRYKFHHNSSKSKRGVGILISSKFNTTIIDTYKDADQNILGLAVDIDGYRMFLVSVYGPNINDPIFFDNLTNILNKYSHLPIVCGGDWNLTYSTDRTANNIDILNMTASPSFYRSGRLQEVCELFNLSDPFRALFPAKREYTYVPRTGNTNRSRIDFFIISDCLLNRVTDCEIKCGLLTRLFDHKCVTLSLFKSQYNINKHRIDPGIFSHKRFPAIVASTVVETFLQHADLAQQGVDIETGLLEIERKKFSR